MVLAAYKVEWTEYEAGWGCRPDGERYYSTKEMALVDTKKILDQQTEFFNKKIGPGKVPHKYGGAALPELVEVTEEQLKVINAKPGIRVSGIDELYKPEYEVLDSGKPAKYPEQSVHPSWDKNTFTTFKDAVQYANKWLGQFGPIPENYKLGDEFDYGGVIKIVEKWP